MIKTVVLNKPSITSAEIKALEKYYTGYIVRTEFRPNHIVLKFWIEA